LLIAKEDILALKDKDQSTQDWIDRASNNVFGILFGQEHSKKEVLTAVLSLPVSNPDFNRTGFITKDNMKNCT